MTKRKDTSTNSLNKESLINNCGINYTMDIICGRWKLLILYSIGNNQLRFNEIQLLIPSISDRMLTLQLNQLIRDGLISRIVSEEVPAKIVYHQTLKAKSLVPILEQMEQWGRSQ